MRSGSPSSDIRARDNFDGVRLHIEYVALGLVKPAPRQLKKHGLRQIKKLAHDIDAHGFNVPVLVDDAYVAVSGNARLMAAERLGLSEIPVIRISHLSEGQLRLFAIFENKIAQEAEFDLDALRVEFAELHLAEPELDLSDSGFAIGEIDAINGLHRANDLADLADLDEAPDAGDRVAVTLPGDLWNCAPHRLICADATDPAVIERLVAGDKIRMVASDPPYNIKIPGIVSGNGRVRHGNFVMGCGEMSEAQFITFLTEFLTASIPQLVDGAILYVCMDWRHVGELLAAAKAARLEYKQLLVWEKSTPANGSFYRSGHELIGVFKSGEGPHRNNVELGRYGRNRSSVLHYPGVNVFSKSRRKSLELHPTVKPVALIADLILDASAPGEIILDPFGGSGTTMVAAEKMNRTAYLCELDPKFADVIVERFEALTGRPAILAATGQTYAEVRAERTPPSAADVGEPINVG